LRQDMQDDDARHKRVGEVWRVVSFAQLLAPQCGQEKRGFISCVDVRSSGV